MISQLPTRRGAIAPPAYLPDSAPRFDRRHAGGSQAQRLATAPWLRPSARIIERSGDEARSVADPANG